MPLFNLDNASVQYNGRAVLNGVTLSIGRGEKIALLGQSGAGKSSFLGLLYGQRVEGAVLLPQDLGLVKALSVFHNIYMARLNRHPAWRNLLNLAWPVKKDVLEVRQIVRKLRFEDKLFTPVGELSGGQQQRTAVGRALYQQGSVLLGDEPLSAVDKKQARHVLDCIIEGHETVIMAMHDVELALAYAKRVIGFKEGRIVMDQPAAGMAVPDFDDLYRH